MFHSSGGTFSFEGLVAARLFLAEGPDLLDEGAVPWLFMRVRGGFCCFEIWLFLLGSWVMGKRGLKIVFEVKENE
jgi:hypothetical protein